ncbi:hypothetical protein Riv7116_6752 [Rivularia sp. PCC 7116]|nr:hypothetical protein Riv7116_6752 [Rivularia sp. PCC 7116]
MKNCALPKYLPVNRSGSLYAKYYSLTIAKKIICCHPENYIAKNEIILKSEYKIVPHIKFLKLNFLSQYNFSENL